MTLEEKIKNQIPEELYLILTKTLPSERNQEKQLEIATQAMKQLDVEDFTPYVGYEDDGDIYVCMKHRLNGYDLETIHASGKHDVSFGENGIWIDVDSIDEYTHLYSAIKENIEAEKMMELENLEKEKKVDFMSKRAERLGDYMQYLVNYILPRMNPGIKKEELEEEIRKLELTIEKLDAEIQKI